MYKKLLYGIAAIIALFHSFGAEAQGTRKPVYVDTSYKPKKLCGVSATYFAAHSIDTSIHPSPSSLVIPPSYPTIAMDTCGKFCVYYDDIALATTGGFNHSSKGTARKAVLCSVLNYIQTTFDFSSIPSGQFIRLRVASSYDVSSLTAPFLTSFYGKGSPYFTAGTGITNGYVQEFVTLGSDPAYGSYHGDLLVNFDKVYLDSFTTESVNYYEGLGSIGKCQTDLYSVLLHEISHVLGWISLIKVTEHPSSGFAVTTLSSAIPGLFTSIDTSICTTPFAYTATAPFSSIKKLITGSTIDTHSTKTLWINKNQPPNNHPVFLYEDRFLTASIASDLSHLDDRCGSYHQAQRISPGDWQDYVMGPFSLDGITKRVFTKGELDNFKHILGYDFTSSVASSSIVTNHTAYSTKMISDEYNHIFNNYLPVATAEKIKRDTLLVNDSGSKVIINLWTDTSLHDADSDILSVMPNSLVNFRGCGEGGNNHNSLVLSNANQTITYTPRHNFYGRAQFGFSLWDGKEKGAFVIYTIDVQKGTNVSAPIGTNIVLNGDFEEGSEVRLKGIDEGVENTIVENDSHREGHLHGSVYADSHPYDYLAWSLMPYGGSLIIKNSYAECDSSLSLTRDFGKKGLSFSSSYGLSAAGGNRYQNLAFQSAFYNLAELVQSCKSYTLEFDYFSYTPLDGKTIKIGFSDTNNLNFPAMKFDAPEFINPKMRYSITPDYKFPTTVGVGWQHVKTTFSYCNDTPSNILVLNSGNTIYLDNISIKQDTLMSVAIVDTVIDPCHNTKLTAKVKHKTIYSCLGLGSVKYEWTVDGIPFSTDSFVYVAPAITTKYKVSVFDGCTLALDSITILGSDGPIVVAKDTSICIGSSAPIGVSVSGTRGTVTYAWTPSTGLSCTTCASPTATPIVTTIYTLIVTDSLGCFKQNVTVYVNPIPTLILSASPSKICGIGGSSTLSASGADSFLWSPSTGLSCTSCISPIASPSITTTYTVTGKTIYGCSKTDTIRIGVFPAVTATIIGSDSLICSGDTVYLLASGGTRYIWTPPTDLSCFICDNPKATPSSNVRYTVFVSDTNGCSDVKDFLIDVNRSPTVVALPKDTSICGVGYITLSASGADTYAWTPSAGLSSPTSATTTAFVSSTTKYIVTGADTNGCVGKDSIDVIVKPKPTVSVTTPIVSLCAPDSVTLSASGATSYVWTPSTGGISCSTCASTKAFPASFPITYTVTASDTNECTSTATVYASIVSCACSPTSVFGTSATTLTTATLPTTVSTGYYHLTNNLNINSNTTMTGAKILIERGVTITVANNVKLTLDNCHLFTCDDDTSKAMWKGIVLASGTTTSGRIEVKNNTLIEDAERAITAINPKIPASGDIISSVHSIYNRNQLDIFVQGLNVSSPAVYPFTIKSNVFTARKFSRVSMAGYPNTWASANSLKTKITPINAQASYSLNRTYAKTKCKDTFMKYMAIHFDYVGFTAGAGTSFSEVVIGGSNSIDSANLFDNHKYGIYSNRSNMTCLNNTFINLSKRYVPSTLSGAVLPDYGGIGIFARSDVARYDRMKIISSAGNVTNRFHDCFDAMGMDNMAEFTVSNAEVTTSHQVGQVAPGAAYPTEIYAGSGIWIAGQSNHSKWSVTSNKFSNVNMGISAYLQNPKSGATTNFDNNLFYAANPDLAYASFKAKQYINRSIEVSIGALGFANTFTANGNIMNKVFNGILVTNLRSSKPTINTNQITLWDTLITGQTDYWQCGIRMESCNTGTISTNNINTPTLNPNVSLGDRIKGVVSNFNTDLKVCSNTTTNIGRGFEFGGKTGQVGTRWIGNTMTNSYKGFVLGSNIDNQGFMYNWVTLTPRTFYGAILNKWNGTWSASAGKFQTVGIDYTNTMLSKLYIHTTGTAATLELPTENGVIPPTALPPYKYMPSGPFTSLLPPTHQWDANCIGSILPTKVSTVPKGGVGKSFAVLLMADSLGYDTDYRPNQWMGQLSMYQMGALDTEYRDSIPELNNFMLAADSSRFKWITDIEMAFATDSLNQVQELLDNPAAGSGYEFIDSNIAISDYPEADYVVNNYADYYSIYLHYLQGTMTGVDSISLNTIAQKCPAKDGAVVYQARSLKQQISKVVTAYNDEGCLYRIGGLFRLAPDAEQTGEQGEQRYALYPNPNNGTFVLKQSIADNKVVNLKVYNAIGLLVHQSEATFVDGQIQVDLKQKAHGVYLVCIGNNKERTTCFRFIIN